MDKTQQQQFHSLPRHSTTFNGFSSSGKALENSQEKAEALLALIDLGRKRSVVKVAVLETKRPVRGGPSVFSVDVNVGGTKSWTIQRNYNQFKKLQRTLKRERFPSPQLPARKLYKVRSKSFLKKRQNALDLWLQVICCIWQSLYGAKEENASSVLTSCEPVNAVLVEFLTKDKDDSFNYMNSPRITKDGSTDTTTSKRNSLNPIRRSISLPKLTLPWTNSPKSNTRDLFSVNENEIVHGRVRQPSDLCLDEETSVEYTNATNEFSECERLSQNSEDCEPTPQSVLYESEGFELNEVPPSPAIIQVPRHDRNESLTHTPKVVSQFEFTFSECSESVIEDDLYDAMHESDFEEDEEDQLDELMREVVIADTNQVVMNFNEQYSIPFALTYSENNVNINAGPQQHRLHSQRHKSDKHQWNTFTVTVPVDESCSLNLVEQVNDICEIPEYNESVQQVDIAHQLNDECYTPVSIPPTPGGRAVFEESWGTYSTALLGYVAESLDAFCEEEALEIDCPRENTRKERHFISGVDALYQTFDSVSESKTTTTEISDNSTTICYDQDAQIYESRSVGENDAQPIDYSTHTSISPRPQDDCIDRKSEQHYVDQCTSNDDQMINAVHTRAKSDILFNVITNSSASTMRKDYRKNAGNRRFSLNMPLSSGFEMEVM